MKFFDNNPDYELSMTVVKFNKYTGEFTPVYEFIKNPYDAWLLAQLAMDDKIDGAELIFILTGTNYSIATNKSKTFDGVYEEALKAEKHSIDNMAEFRKMRKERGLSE